MPSITGMPLAMGWVRSTICTGACYALAAGLSAGWNTPSTRIVVPPVFSMQCTSPGGRCAQLPAATG